jgi:DNA polymerase V
VGQTGEVWAGWRRRQRVRRLQHHGFRLPRWRRPRRPDLSLLLDLQRPHRYPVRVLGDALAERGILPGDILIADTATAPSHGRVAIVMLHGEVWVAQLAFRGGPWWMRPSLSGRPLIALDGDGAEVWAVVAALVRPRV